MHQRVQVWPTQITGFRVQGLISILRLVLLVRLVQQQE